MPDVMVLGTAYQERVKSDNIGKIDDNIKRFVVFVIKILLTNLLWKEFNGLTKSEVNGKMNAIHELIGRINNANVYPPDREYNDPGELKQAIDENVERRMKMWLKSTNGIIDPSRKAPLNVYVQEKFRHQAKQVMKFERYFGEQRNERLQQFVAISRHRPIQLDNEECIEWEFYL